MVQKALKTANSEKFVFSCQTSNVLPEPPNSLVFGPDARCALDSVFCPEKQANSIPLSLSPFATALSPLAFGLKNCAKAAACDTSARRTCHRLCHRSVWLRFLVQKRSRRPTPKSSFFVSDGKVGCLSLKFRSFSVESRLINARSQVITTETRGASEAGGFGLKVHRGFRFRTKVGIPTSLSHQGRNSDFAPSFQFSSVSDAMGSASQPQLVFSPKKPGAGLVRAWCGPGLGLALPPHRRPLADVRESYRDSTRSTMSRCPEPPGTPCCGPTCAAAFRQRRSC